MTCSFEPSSSGWRDWNHGPERTRIFSSALEFGQDPQWGCKAQVLGNDEWGLTATEATSPELHNLFFTRLFGHLALETFVALHGPLENPNGLIVVIGHTSLPQFGEHGFEFT